VGGGRGGMRSCGRHGRRRTESLCVRVTRTAIVSFSWRQLRPCTQSSSEGWKCDEERLGRESGHLPFHHLPSASQQLASYARQHQQPTNRLRVALTNPLCHPPPQTKAKHPACPALTNTLTACLETEQR